MLLSELMTSPTSEPLAFGVEVDADLLDPPEGLRQIGLIYKGTSTAPDDIFIDAVIACTLAGVDTIAEIPCLDTVDATSVLTIAGNAGFSVAVLPPEREENLATWCARCAEFATAFLETPHFAGHLYPISGYFGHLVAKSVSGVQAHQPNDPYVRQRFFDAVPVEWSDAAKAAMLAAWEERAGGAAAFDALLKTIAGATVIEAMDLIDRIMDDASNGTPGAP